MKEFVDNTTLHGIRYAFMERHFLVRFIWAVLVLISGAYYLYTVRTAFQKYYDRPVNTVLKHEHVDEMDFPAVTICSRNMFDLSKLLMTDDNPVFKSSGLNISSCAVTAGVRGTLPCGLAMLCCCSPRALANVAPEITNCKVIISQILTLSLDTTVKISVNSLDLSAIMTGVRRIAMIKISFPRQPNGGSVTPLTRVLTAGR